MASKLLVLAICLQGIFHLAVQGGQVDNRLTDTEIRRIFHRNRNEVPDYKTVMLETSATHRSRRELRPVEFEVDGTKVQLKLTPVEENVLNYVPVWTVETDRQNSSGRTYRKLSEKEAEFDGIFYEDSEKAAIMLAYYKDQNIYYDGIFGESSMAKIVRSVPEKWWTRPDHEAGDDHVVFDVDKDKGTTEPIGSPGHSENLDKPLDVMYPKLLIVVASELFKALGEDIPETVKYVSTFWNAVNLKYIEFTSPKVKIVITGVLISKDDTALRYIYDSRRPEDITKINNMDLLNNANDYFRKYFKNDVHFSNYDSTITMTNLNSGPVAGTAYIGQICANQRNIGFIRDDGSYSGVQTAMHELGHLLSLPHDGYDAAASCDSFPNPTISTVMAGVEKGRIEKYVWSECSKKILQTFASTKSAECMRNRYRS